MAKHEKKHKTAEKQSLSPVMNAPTADEIVKPQTDGDIGDDDNSEDATIDDLLGTVPLYGSDSPDSYPAYNE